MVFLFYSDLAMDVLLHGNAWQYFR